MKRILLFLFTLGAATEAHAGLTYRFESVSDGLMARTMTGTVKADGSAMRIDISAGDGMFFNDGSVVLSLGGNAVTVLDPAKKTFYTVDLTSLLGRASGALSQLGSVVKAEVKNPRVVVRDAGTAGLMEAYPVRRSHVVSSFDLTLNMFGEKSPARVEMNSDIWATEKLPSALSNILQNSRLRTGIDAVDKMLESQTSSIKGFPLKQITVTNVTVRGNTTSTTTTSRVTAIRQAAIAPAEFTMPKGYRKVDSPIDALLGKLGQ